MGSIYGQWYGRVAGATSGAAILNVDRARINKEGSISFVPNDGNLNNIMRALFNVSGDNFDGRLDLFQGFSAEGVVFPQRTGKYQQSGSGIIKGKFLTEDKITGEWSTDLGIAGNFELSRVQSPKAYPANNIITWDNFKKEIIKFQDSYGKYFFRGQANSMYPLQTKFHRKGCWDLYRFYNNKLPELFDYLGVMNQTRYSIANDYDFSAALLLAQHHHFPTPLLDWTLSPYIAAYFAFGYETKDEIKSVRVFVFHADRWRIEQPDRTEGMFINPGKGITVKPLEIPLAGNKRAIAQCARSVFSNVENIENVLRWSEFSPTSNEIKPKPYLEYFDIAVNERKTALADLRSMNIHEMSMFPDLDTACRILAKEYFGE